MNPWQKFAEDHEVGSIVEGVVRNIADFGLFVAVNDGNPDLEIDALVPAVELTWEDNPEEELKKYNKGDIVKGVVLTTDVERERVTLGIKQLVSDSFSEISSKLSKGSIVTCIVSEIKNDGIEVELSDGIKTFIKKGDLSKHKAEQKPERFAVGDKVDASVTSVDKTARKLNLSIKAYEVEQEKKVIAEYGSTNSGASLGDILGAALGQSQNQDKNKE